MGKAAIVVTKGDKYARLTVIKELVVEKGKRRKFRWKCDCGNIVEVQLDRVRCGNTKSCGCLHKDAVTKHGGSNHLLYRVLNAMEDRCHNQNNERYADYGGRGIKVCQQWRQNKGSFISWALSNGYARGLQIDRKNNNKGYSPNNCRFIPAKRNMLNRRITTYVTHKGERMTFIDCVDKYGLSGLSYGTVERRLNKYGWTMHQALTTPTRSYTRSK